MNRIAIKTKNKKIDLFPVEKTKAETEKIPHLTVFNMILVDKNTAILFRISKECDFKGFWTFVAGHIESMKEGKKPVLSVIRETKEETGIELDENELYVLGKKELKKTKSYRISKEDLIKEAEISKNLGFNIEPPHLVLPFVSFLKEKDRIILGNELDKFEKVKIDGLDGYKMTPITKIMVERFLKLSNSNII